MHQECIALDSRGGGGERTVPDVSARIPERYSLNHPANSCQLHTEASIVWRSRILTSKPHHRCWWCWVCTGPRCSSTFPDCRSTCSLDVTRSRWWTTPFGGRPADRGCRRQRWPRCRGWQVVTTPTTEENLEPDRPITWRRNRRRCRFRVFHLIINNFMEIFFFLLRDYRAGEENGKWRKVKRIDPLALGQVARRIVFGGRYFD